MAVVLTVLSAPGSPGASTTALHLAAHWAESGREVLFIEADPGGGKLSHRLGVQFTPGSSSLLAAGLEFSAANLVEHSQDVLYNSLHVMPCTASPTGANDTVRFLSDHAEALRDVSESGMAVVIDGGSASDDSLASPLVLQAGALIVVARGGGPLGLDRTGSTPAGESPEGGPRRRVVTVGESPLSESEWLDRGGLVFSGSIIESPELYGDLSAFVGRNKRRLKRWRQSLNAVGDVLLPDAAPEPGRPRPSARPAQAPEAPPQVLQPPTRPAAPPPVAATIPAPQPAAAPVPPAHVPPQPPQPAAAAAPLSPAHVPLQPPQPAAAPVSPAHVPPQPLQPAAAAAPLSPAHVPPQPPQPPAAAPVPPAHVLSQPPTQPPQPPVAGYPQAAPPARPLQPPPVAGYPQAGAPGFGNQPPASPQPPPPLPPGAGYPQAAPPARGGEAAAPYQQPAQPPAAPPPLPPGAPPPLPPGAPPPLPPGAPPPLPSGAGYPQADPLAYESRPAVPPRPPAGSPQTPPPAARPPAPHGPTNTAPPPPAPGVPEPERSGSFRDLATRLHGRAATPTRSADNSGAH